MRRLLLLRDLAGLLVIGVTPALADRGATKKERAAIDRTVRAYVHEKHSQAPSEAKISKVLVSTANHK